MSSSIPTPMSDIVPQYAFHDTSTRVKEIPYQSIKVSPKKEKSLSKTYTVFREANKAGRESVFLSRRTPQNQINRYKRNHIQKLKEAFPAHSLTSTQLDAFKAYHSAISRITDKALELLASNRLETKKIPQFIQSYESKLAKFYTQQGYDLYKQEITVMTNEYKEAFIKLLYENLSSPEEISKASILLIEYNNGITALMQTALTTIYSQLETPLRVKEVLDKYRIDLKEFDRIKTLSLIEN
ncbi:MAG: hypothetical protein JWO53_578 [Chlamydiia bacterium]|nr:hypothetical protein [Chlamydiia bacterium]